MYISAALFPLGSESAPDPDPSEALEEEEEYEDIDADDELEDEEAAKDWEAMSKALSDINLTPTSGMKVEAQKGLDWRKEFGRGGTAAAVPPLPNSLRQSRPFCASTFMPDVGVRLISLRALLIASQSLAASSSSSSSSASISSYSSSSSNASDGSGSGADSDPNGNNAADMYTSSPPSIGL